MISKTQREREREHRWPPSQALASPDRAAPIVATLAQIMHQPSFFFFSLSLSSSSTLLLLLAQRRWSSRHRPPAHSSQTSHTWRSQPTPPSSQIHKHLRPTSPIASHALTSIGCALILTIDCRPCSTKLSNALADLATTTDRRFGSYRPTSHSTPPPNPPDLAAAASIHSDPLFPNLSLFPSISHSFFLLSPSLWIKNVFIFIFGCVKCIFWNFIL